LVTAVYAIESDTGTELDRHDPCLHVIRPFASPTVTVQVAQVRPLTPIYPPVSTTPAIPASCNIQPHYRPAPHTSDPGGTDESLRGNPVSEPPDSLSHYNMRGAAPKLS
jgi:hypothetical protein